MKSLTSEEVERMHAFLKHYHPVSNSALYEVIIHIRRTGMACLLFCILKNQLNLTLN